MYKTLQSSTRVKVQLFSKSQPYAGAADASIVSSKVELFCFIHVWRPTLISFGFNWTAAWSSLECRRHVPGEDSLEVGTVCVMLSSCSYLPRSACGDSGLLCVKDVCVGLGMEIRIFILCAWLWLKVLKRGECGDAQSCETNWGTQLFASGFNRRQNESAKKRFISTLQKQSTTRSNIQKLIGYLTPANASSCKTSLKHAVVSCSNRVMVLSDAEQLWLSRPLSLYCRSASLFCLTVSRSRPVLARANACLLNIFS